MKWLPVLFALFAFSALAADISGNWKATAEGPNGALERTFTFKQEGNKVTGETTSSFTGKSVIADGKVDGDSITFKAGKSTYAGTLKGEQIELQRKIDIGFEWNRRPKDTSASRPAIGPPPDGSDPSIDSSWELPPSIPVILRRAQR